MEKLILLFIIPFFSFGQCVYGDCENGFGFYIFKDGITLYQGEFKNGELNGWGTRRVFDENGIPYGVYDGEFKNGDKHGWGTQTIYNDKGELLGTYIGNFRNNQEHGWGLRVFGEDMVQQGEFINGDFQK